MKFVFQCTVTMAILMGINIGRVMDLNQERNSHKILIKSDELASVKKESIEDTTKNNYSNYDVTFSIVQVFALISSLMISNIIFIIGNDKSNGATNSKKPTTKYPNILLEWKCFLNKTYLKIMITTPNIIVTFLSFKIFIFSSK